MEYSQLLDELNGYREEEFASFQQRIVCPARQKILGVRTPVLRGLVKKHKDEWREMLNFPDEYYEVTFIKLNAVALLPYEEFVKQVERCVACIENWAICDTFKAKCLKKRQDDFLPYLERFVSDGREFFQRYALVTLLSYYVEEKYLPKIFEILGKCDFSLYYVHMGGAWLLAEVLIKEYAAGLAYLKENRLPVGTHNKAILKARESFRLTEAQKAEIFALRRKEK